MSTFSKLDALSRIRDDRTLVDKHAIPVLLMLLAHADSEGRCFPGTELLAAETRLSRHAVMRALAELEKAGYIMRERRWRGGGAGGRASNSYALAEWLGSPQQHDRLSRSQEPKRVGLSRQESGVKSLEGQGLSRSQLQEAGQGSWSDEASPKAPASGGSARVAKTPFPESFAPDAESLALAHKRGVAASDAVRVLRELATSNGWRKACWQAAYRAHLLTMPDRPSGPRVAADPAADARAVNSAIDGVLAAAYGSAAQAKARTLVGPDLGRFALAAERAWRDRPRLVAT